MEKDIEIQKLTKYFLDKYGSTNILICDFWEIDLGAIGLTDRTKKYLVYICKDLRENNKYSVSLEDPPLDESFPYTPAGDFDNLSIDEVEKFVVSHLRLKYDENLQ